MKVTCILASYNRPKWIRHSLKSIQDQSHKDYEVIVVDESNLFDIYSTVKEFSFPQVRVHHFKVTQEQRRSQNRIGVKINFALTLAKGDLICFLCDDDYYYPTWFERAALHFNLHPEQNVGYGILRHSSSREMVFPETGATHFPNAVLKVPILDHNQVIYRRFSIPYRWPEEACHMNAPDGVHFNSIARDHLFYPIDTFAVIKRSHPKSLQKTIGSIVDGTAEDLRE
jgi:spore maturation protein CgeD